MTDSTTNCYLSTAVDSNYNTYVAYWSNYLTGQTYDVVITKINSNNLVRWTKTFSAYNTTGLGWSPSITVDPNDNIYFTFPTIGTTSGETKTGLWDIVVYKIDTNGNHLWHRQRSSFNTTGTNENPTISVDSSANVYITYRTTGTVSGQLHTGITDIVVFKLNTNGVFQWVKQSGLFNTSSDNYEPTITTDQYSNVFVSYYTDGRVAGQLKTGTTDVVVFKLNQNGIFQWVTQSHLFNTTNNNETPQISADPQQGLAVVYITNGQSSGQSLTGTIDLVVFRLDALSGRCLWVSQQPIFNTVDYNDYPSISTDLNGNIYVAYCTNGVISGQTATGQTYDVVLFKLNINGQIQWTQQQPTFNTTGDNINPVIQVDAQGSLLVAYPTSGTSIHNPYDIVVFKMLTSVEHQPVITSDTNGDIYYAYYTDSQKSDGNYDLVVGKKNSSGTTLWSNIDPRFNTVDSNLNPSIIAYGTGTNIFIYVVFQTSGVTSGADARFPYDLVVVKFNSNGQIIWIQQQPTFNTTRSDESPSIDVDSSGNLCIVYQTTGRVSGGYRVAYKDKYDIAVFKMDPNGNVKWIRQSRYYNNYRGARNPNIKCDRVNNDVIYLSFSTDGRVYQQPFSGYSDIVIVKLNQLGEIMTIESGDFAGKLWILQYPSFNTDAYDETPCLVTDNLGYLYLCYTTTPYGYASGQSSPVGHISGQSNIGGSDIIIAKFDPLSGTVVKSAQNQTFDTTGDELYPSMTYCNGYLYIAYQTNGTVSGQKKTGQIDVVVMKVNCITLEVIWIRQNDKFNTNVDDTNPSITTDSFGNSYIAYETGGNFYGQSFGSSYQAVVVLKLNNNGTFAWVRR